MRVAVGADAVAASEESTKVLPDGDLPANAHPTGRNEEGTDEAELLEQRSGELDLRVMRIIEGDPELPPAGGQSLL